MIIYAYIMLFFCIAGLLTSDKVEETMLGTAILLPFIGRVAGWW